MSIPGAANPLLFASIAAAPAAFQIDRSLRFNSADSAYLNATLGTATDQDVFTLSMWVKRAVLGAAQSLFGVSTNHHLKFLSDDKLKLTIAGNGVTTTTAVFRDPAAWYHVVWQQNGTAHTLYVNNVSVGTGTATSSVFNTAVAHQIGANNTTNFLDGYLTNILFIDGQALLPTSFGQYDDNNNWNPRAYSGTFGNNGFRLRFNDDTNTTTISEDSSGNNNDWTANNISVSSGPGNDSLIDTPTNYEASPNNGGNYATLNPLATSSQLDLADGNLNVSCGGADKGSSLATIMLSGSGKYYFECDMTNDKNGACGIAPAELAYSVGTNTRFGRDESGHALRMDTSKYQANSNATNVDYSFTVAVGDIIGCLINLDDDEISWSQNGTVGTAYSIDADTAWLPFAGCFDGAGATDHTVNFGQQPFQHLPTGYQSICTTNLPEPTIADGSTAMDVALYTGNGSTQTISGLEFSPDFVWIKNRVVGDSHGLFDVIRGAEERLRSDTTGAEQTQTNTLTSFNSDGFSLGNQVFNDSGESLVAWAWDAGTSTVSNTDGSITSNVRANPSAGVSIVSWTGDATNARIGHGLGAAPGFIIVKNRDASADWMVFHQKADPVIPANKYLELNTANARVDATKWDDFLPTSTVFGVNGSTTSNSNNDEMIAYCFAPVEGFSAFGSYTGNGSSNGPFVYTGFRPRWILIKDTGGAIHWRLLDTARNTYNLAENGLRPSSADAENTTNMAMDILSNGFKIKATAAINASGNNHIYAAFAEHPFRTARAR